MRADVVKRPHPGVIAAHHDQRDAGRMREQAIVEGLGQLRLVAGNDPRGPEQLLLLLPEDRLVGIEARIDVVRRREFRRRVPLGGGSTHDQVSFRAILSLHRRRRQDRSLLCLFARVSSGNVCRRKQTGDHLQLVMQRCALVSGRSSRRKPLRFGICTCARRAASMTASALTRPFRLSR